MRVTFAGLRLPGAEEQDIARQEHIEAFGIRFLRFTNEDVYKNIDGVCQRMFNFIDELRSKKFKGKTE